MNPRRPNVDIGDAAMLATATIWAGNNVLVKAYVDRIGAVPYVFGRFVIVCVLLFAWLRFRRVDLRIARSDLPRFFLTGVTGFAIYNLLFTVGLAHTSAFSVAILVGLGPVFTLVLSAVMRIERIRPVQWAGVLCAMAGVTVFVGDKLAGAAPALGDILSITAAAVFAIYSLATRPIVRTYGSPVVTAWSALFGLIASLPVTLPPAVDKDWTELGPAAWLALLYSAAMSMLVAYTIWGWAIERKGVARTVPYLYLVPPLTGGLAIVFLNERFGILKVAGAVLVLLGVGLARRGGVSLPVEREPTTSQASLAGLDGERASASAG